MCITSPYWSTQPTIARRVLCSEAARGVGVVTTWNCEGLLLSILVMLRNTPRYLAYLISYALHWDFHEPSCTTTYMADVPASHPMLRLTLPHGDCEGFRR